ncbi:MAG TPA: hypothetical protein VGH81_07685 [Rudaea sp.]
MSMILSPPDSRHVERPQARALTIALSIAIAAYAAAGVFAMLLFAPRVPYADQWRHYAHLLTMPFPSNVFEVDGGHVEVLPHLLRLADLHFFAASEWLQIIAGTLFALVAVVLLVQVIWSDRSIARPTRMACLLAAVLGVYWLGNLRALAQSGDSVHVYLILTCLAVALLLLLRSNAGGIATRDLLGASSCCVVATFSFGTGIATFAAVLAVLFVRRAPPRQWLLVVLVGALTLAAYFALPQASARYAPVSLDTALTSLRLLGATFVYLFWPLLDPAAAASSPAPLRTMLLATANAWTAQFGEIRHAVFPQAAFGAVALVLAAVFGLRLRRAASRRERAAGLGFALACFGIALALLVALARADYFSIYDDQIIAPRYLPWWSLCWAGLLIAAFAQMRSPPRAAFLALVLALLAMPSEIGMGTLARRVREVAEDAAVFAAVGVAPESISLGEATGIEDLRPALQALRAAHAAVFAWPETALLGEDVPAGLVPLAASGVTAEPVVNRFGGGGSRVFARFDATPCASRVLVASAGRVIGLLRRSSDGHWHGVARGNANDADIRFFALCR